MRVLVTGATGYVGGRLVPELLAAGHDVTCLARTPAKLDDRPWRGQVTVTAGDAMVPDDLDAALDGVDAAYYLLHSMDGQGDFSRREREMAQAFADAADRADGLRRIVYLGGLVAPGGTPSRHLASRLDVGTILSGGSVPVTELRASVVIGSGSASFEMVRNLVEVLPVMVTPKWVANRCQPIAIRDLLAYLVAVLDTDEAAGAVLEVGGPDILTYGEMMQQYAEVAGLRRRLFVPVPMITPKLSSHWVGLVTPIPVGLAKPLVHSLVNDSVVSDDRILRLVPRELLPFRQAVALALTRIQDLDVVTTWAGADLSGRVPPGSGLAEVAGPQQADPTWAGGTVLTDHREVATDADVATVWAAVEGIGGARGYYAADVLWSVRGLMDKLAGGIGRRRGRRHPDRLAVGEALDFWRVERLVRPTATQPGTAGPETAQPWTAGHLRLRAEMRLPGEAWLDFDVEARPGGGALLRQRARFHPRGLWGRIYWWTLWPFHQVLFPRMARRIAAPTTSLPRSSGH